jgi:hypothetical protein
VASLFTKDLTKDGDVEANPGPETDFCHPLQLKNFKAEFRKEIVKWLLHKVGPVGLKVAAGVWYDVPDEHRLVSNQGRFAVHLLYLWERQFGVRPGELPNPLEPIPDLEIILGRWVGDKIVPDHRELYEAVRAHPGAIQLTSHSNNTNLQQPRANPPTPKRRRQPAAAPQQSTAENAENTAAEDMAILLGPHPLPRVGQHTCPIEGCSSSFDDAWGIAAHINASHTNSPLPATEILMASSLAHCRGCNKVRPTFGRCPSCPVFVGRVAKSLLEADYGAWNHPMAEDETMEPPEEPEVDADKEFMLKLLASFSPTTPFIPSHARRKLGGILADELVG